MDKGADYHEAHDRRGAAEETFAVSEPFTVSFTPASLID